MPSKQDLYDFCRTFVKSRIDRIENSIRDIQKSLASETKSSAGDKHETGRAMLHIEREKLGQQLAEAEKMDQILLKVSLRKNTKIAGPGSWVKTSKADYYLAISAGKYESTDNDIFCISVGTPMGQILLGKSVGDSIQFKGNTMEILNVD